MKLETINRFLNIFDVVLVVSVPTPLDDPDGHVTFRFERFSSFLRKQDEYLKLHPEKSL